MERVEAIYKKKKIMKRNSNSGRAKTNALGGTMGIKKNKQQKIDEESAGGHSNFLRDIGINKRTKETRSKYK